MMQKISKVGGPPFPVEFTADSIELEVPVPPDGWRLSCPTHPAVSSGNIYSPVIIESLMMCMLNS